MQNFHRDDSATNAQSRPSLIPGPPTLAATLKAPGRVPARNDLLLSASYRPRAGGSIREIRLQCCQKNVSAGQLRHCRFHDLESRSTRADRGQTRRPAHTD